MPDEKLIPAVEIIRARRRNGAPRAKTLSVRGLMKSEVPHPADREEDVRRPLRRSDCLKGPRPCPWVSCEYHLYLDVNPDNGSLQLNFPDLEPWELAETCALDVALRGVETLDEVGMAIGLSPERVRQIELVAKRRLAKVVDPATEGELTTMTLFEEARGER
jgi:hypothetical protein